MLVQVNRTTAGSTPAAQLTIEHAAVLEEGQFEPLTSQIIQLDALGPITIVVTGHTRFVRWSMIQAAGSVCAFTVDLILRD